MRLEVPYLQPAKGGGGELPLWVGCCGWLAGRARYFKQFRPIELQSTFYRPPAPDMTEKWRRDAPRDFRFLPLLPEGVAVDHASRIRP
jgi:uncharacterized protein YecE (DUF72 family)